MELKLNVMATLLAVLLLACTVPASEAQQNGTPRCVVDVCPQTELAFTLPTNVCDYLCICRPGQGSTVVPQLLPCPPGTVFEAVLGVCTWPAEVPGCECCKGDGTGCTCNLLGRP